MSVRRPQYMGRHSLRCRIAIALVLGASGFGVQTEPADHSNLSGPLVRIAERPVALTLVQSDDRSRVPWPAGTVQIALKSIVATQNTIIANELEATGIDPDSNALSLVADLNPQLRNLASPRPGMKIVMLQVLATGALKEQLTSGHLLVLTVDPELRREIHDSVTQILTLGEQFPRLPSDVFTTPGQQALLVSQVGDLLTWYAAIRNASDRHKDPPMRRDTMQQLRDEARAFSTLLAKAVGEGQRFSPSDEEQIAAIHSDLEREITRFDDVMSGRAPVADAPPCCAVVVDIVQGHDDAQKREMIKGLRIYYVVYGMFHQPLDSSVQEISDLTSARIELPPKTYCFWAALDGQPDALKTPVVKVDLYAQRDKTRPLKLQLRATDGKCL